MAARCLGSSKDPRCRRSRDWRVRTARRCAGHPDFRHRRRRPCRAIREQSGLNGPGPTAISSRIWRLGRYQQHGRVAEICLVRRLREETAQEILDHVRGAIDTETSVALVSLGSSEVPTVVARQLDRLRMTVSCAEDLLRERSVRPFALDFGRVRLAAGKQAPDARLQVDRIGRRAIFEGIEIDIEPRDFDAVVLLWRRPWPPVVGSRRKVWRRRYRRVRGGRAIPNRLIAASTAYAMPSERTRS